MSLGGNQVNDELARRAKSLSDILDQIAKLQSEARTIKQNAKDEGYDMKAFAQVVKELRKGEEYQVAQLQLELVLDTYRAGVGLPVTLEVAQQRAAAASKETPEPKSTKRRAKETMQ